MSKRSFTHDYGTIKSLVHFDFPYYKEPNDGLDDDVGIATWTRAGNFNLAGSILPYAASGAPKFGWRCGYFSGSSSYITGANNNGVFNIEKGTNYCISMYIKRTGTGTFLTIGDFSLSIDSSGYMTCGDFSSKPNVMAANYWHRLVIPIDSNGKIETIFMFMTDSSYTSSYSYPHVFSYGAIQLYDSSLVDGITPSEIKLGGGFSGYIDEFCFASNVGDVSSILNTDLGDSSPVGRPLAGILDISKVGGWGTGADGDVVISTNGNIVLSDSGYTSSLSATNKTLTISYWVSGLINRAIGKEVMILVSDSSTNYNTPIGTYAFAKIAGIDGNTITLEEEISIENGYDFNLTNVKQAYVIVVPNFNTLIVNSGATITSNYYQYIVFRCKRDCTINGNIIGFIPGSNIGNKRTTNDQMTHSKLIDKLVISSGLGIFITCGGTFTTSANARLGGSWSGLGEKGNGAAGYGGHAYSDITSYTQYVGGGYGGRGYYMTINKSTGAVTAAYNNTYTRTGANGANTVSGTTAANGYGGSGGGGCGGNGGNCATKGTSTRSKVAGSGGGGQGGSGGSGGSDNGHTYAVAGNNAVGVHGGNPVTYTGTNLIAYGGAGGGAPGGNGGCGEDSDTRGGSAGTNIIIVANKASIAQESISSGGEGGTSSYGISGGGGTGFCYIAARSLV